MSAAARPLNCLVIGKAKTGTTALAHLIQSETGSSVLHMEPKGIREILPALPEDDGYLSKIIFEHFRGRFRHLNAIIHNELYAQYDKVVFIRRDIRDEMVSRLLYLAKIIAPGNHPESAWREWIDVLREKERSPGSLSFREMCEKFQSIFGPNAWRDITNLHTDTEREFNNFISNSIKRDHAVVQYEDLIDNNIDGLMEYFGHTFSGTMADVELGKFAYTKRSGQYGGWRSFFLSQDVDDIRSILDRKGLDRFDDWDLEAAEALNPSDFSQYVIRMSARPLEVFQ
ncbi:MAG: hypothetical protein AAFQ22_12830 [Pseudomonadota bacterium]